VVTQIIILALALFRHLTIAREVRTRSTLVTLMFRDSLLIFGTVAGQSQLSLCRPHDETCDELTHGLVYRFIHVLGGGRAAER